ncbi:MAG: M28 family peptidase [Candidatus Lokiarchaeota archaeon]|nr:M28 family peptidase [Candidatus Lokiarchaeota archaeon]
MAELFRQEDADYVYDLVKKICVDIGPGCPCSPQEKQRGNIFKHEMQKFADKVEVEPFTCAPKAFIGWFKIGCVLGIISLVFFFLSYYDIYPILFSLIGLIIAIFIFLMMLFEFIFYTEFIDRFYKKKESFNVIGRIIPDEEVKNIIILSGHHDSALQFNWLRYLKYGYYFTEFVLIFSVTTLLIGLTRTFIYNLLGMPKPESLHFFAILMLIFFPMGFIFGVFFAESGKNGGKVPGATDNLASSAMAVRIGQILKSRKLKSESDSNNTKISDHKNSIPKNTEIRIISFGCEEAGTRGSYRYVARHLRELKEKNTMCINFETICTPNITILTTDRNSTLKNSKKVVRKLDNAANIANISHKVEPMPFGGGGTDTLPFSKAGIDAACLFAMKVPSQMIKFYHQPWDDYTILNKEAIGNTMKIALEFLKNEVNLSNRHV